RTSFPSYRSFPLLRPPISTLFPYTTLFRSYAAAKLKMPLRLVTWLPLHHDMGIILSLFVVIMGLPFEMMRPRDFIQQPKRWIDQLKRKDIDEKLAATYAV